MEWKWNYGEGILTLPASILECDATPEQLRVLLWLASDATLFSKPAQLSKLADCGRDEVGDILHFWQDCGVLSGDSVEKAVKPSVKKSDSKKTASQQPKEEKKPTVLARADEFPNYTTEQLADLFEKKKSMKLLLDEAQNVWGKIFNPYETQILAGLSDYLGLEDEYILLLLAHCKRIDKKSLREVERYALKLNDEGVTTPTSLEEYVRFTENRRTIQGKVRAMFGIGSRDFTSKENKMLDAWNGYGYDENIIRRAYEITIAGTNEPSLPYANSILTRWHNDGLRTLEEIDARIESDKDKRAGTPMQGSFDTDAFFEAALRRGYSNGEDDTPSGDGK